MYLLLMWGYSVLPNAQWYAAFLALVMGSMAIFWVHESAVDVEAAVKRAGNARSDGTTADRCSEYEAGADLFLRRRASSTATEDAAPGADPNDDTTLYPSLEASVLRLDSLKTELTLQYAQFGRDQSLLNSNGLGSWHGNRNQGAR
jgi:hypothetical protein